MLNSNSDDFLPSQTGSNLDGFFASKLLEFESQGWITELLRKEKSGKEATVFCCRAHPSVGTKFLAAKIYRPGRFGGYWTNEGIQPVFHRDISPYEEGRVIGDRRMARAVRKKSRKGRQFQMSSWSNTEFELLCKLYDAGVAVPQPIFHGDNAILMEYIGDEESAAPMLRQVDLAPEEAIQLFDFLLDNIEPCLAANCIHADLSPYNILYWNGSLTIIDWPQAVDPRFNPNAYVFLRRDIENVCRWWSKYGIHHDPFQLAEDLWRRWLQGELDI